MTRNKTAQYYNSILQMSFELSKLVEPDKAKRLLDLLSNALYSEEGQVSQKQINEALKIIGPFPVLRERVRELMNESSLGHSSSLEYLESPGEPMHVEKPVKGRWLICPIDNERFWDYEISSGERRLCLKHRVYFMTEVPNSNL